MFLKKVQAKQETEKLIASKKKKLEDFLKRYENHYYDVYISRFFKPVAVFL